SVRGTTVLPGSEPCAPEPLAQSARHLPPGGRDGAMAPGATSRPAGDHAPPRRPVLARRAVDDRGSALAKLLVPASPGIPPRLRPHESRRHLEGVHDVPATGQFAR